MSIWTPSTRPSSSATTPNCAASRSPSAGRASVESWRPPATRPVSSGSWSVPKRSILMLRSLLENPVGRCMVARHARPHPLMSTTAGTGRFPPAIAPCASQTVTQPHSQLGRRRHLTQQREQSLHVDQLADCHQLALHIVEQLLV